MNTIALTHSHFLRYFMSHTACAGPEVIPPVLANTRPHQQHWLLRFQRVCIHTKRETETNRVWKSSLMHLFGVIRNVFVRHKKSQEVRMGQRNGVHFLRSEFTQIKQQSHQYT